MHADTVRPATVSTRSTSKYNTYSSWTATVVSNSYVATGVVATVVEFDRNGTVPIGWLY